jgi:hypothetical protein
VRIIGDRPTISNQSADDRVMIKVLGGHRSALKIELRSFGLRKTPTAC